MSTPHWIRFCLIAPSLSLVALSTASLFGAEVGSLGLAALAVLFPAAIADVDGNGGAVGAIGAVGGAAVIGAGLLATNPITAGIAFAVGGWALINGAILWLRR